MVIETPFEILELEDGGSLETRIEHYEYAPVTIHPAYAPQGKEVNALRIHVSKEDKQFFPWYWDVTAQTLVAQLKPFLDAGAFRNQRFKITKHGSGPKARFSLEVNPI